MRKVVVLESMTVDGVYDAQTIVQWGAPYASDEREKYIREAILEADALLYGRRTYDLQAYYWPGLKNNEYGIADRKNSIPKYVVTSTPLKAQWNNSNIVKGNIVDEIAQLKRQPGKDILIEGSGTLVESLMQAGLVDEVKLLVHPAIMGSGKRLFNDGVGMTALKLVESKPLSKGVVLLRYEPAR